MGVTRGSAFDVQNKIGFTMWEWYCWCFIFVFDYIENTGGFPRWQWYFFLGKVAMILLRAGADSACLDYQNQNPLHKYNKKLYIYTQFFFQGTWINEYLSLLAERRHIWSINTFFSFVQKGVWGGKQWGRPCHCKTTWQRGESTGYQKHVNKSLKLPSTSM